MMFRRQYALDYTMIASSVTPQHDLPDWIQRARQGFDWGALCVLILSLLAAGRFIVQPGLPLTLNGESAVVRAADTLESFRQGRLYPRWNPHALHGYGAPISHYTPPGVSWSAAALSLLANTEPIDSVRVLWVASFIASGLALYALVMRRVNAVAGLVAAALYLYSPYIGLTLPHISGNLAEMLGLTLLIIHLWAVNRLCERNSPWDAGGVALSGAALILTSPLHSAAAFLLSLPLLALMVAPRWGLRRLLQAWSIGLLLSAFYWLPALLEQGLVRWIEPSNPIPAASLSLADLLRPIALFDPSEMIPAPQLGLGLALLLATVLSLLTLWRYRRLPALRMIRIDHGLRASLRILFQLVYLTLSLMGVFWVILQPRTPHWLVGILTLCFAIGGTLFLELRTRLQPQGQRAVLAVTAFLLTLAAVPVLFPTRPLLIVNTSPAAHVEYEQQGFGVAGVSQGEAVPTTLSDSFLKSDTYVTGYETETVNRFSIDAREQNRASVVAETPEMHVFQVWKPQGELVTMQLASFEGWTASLDGVPVPTSSDPDTGLLQLALPPSSGQTLVVTLDTTPPRILGWLLSASGLVILAAWVGWRVRRDKPARYRVLEYMTMAETRLVGFVLLLSLVAVVLSYQGIGGFSLHPQGWYAIRDSIFLRSRSNAGLELLAYRIESSTVHSGDTIPITLYWQTTQSLNASYVVELSIRDVSSGNTLVTAPLHAPAFYPTRRWIRGMYLRDEMLLALPAESPAGRYVVTVKVYPCEPECRPEAGLNFFDASGQLAGTLLTLPQILDVTP